MINRSLNLVIALLVVLVVGIETHTYWLYQLRPWQPATSFGRLVFYYSFFTVLSNLMLAISCLVLVLKPNYQKTWFNVVHLTGLISVIITMIVYNLMLRGIHRPPTLLLVFANENLHVVIPLLGVISWFIFGPFNRIQFKTIFYSFICLVTYGFYIFLRGYFTGQYPYPFINVNRVGYEKALIAVASIAVLFFIIAISLKLIEYWRMKIAKSK